MNRNSKLTLLVAMALLVAAFAWIAIGMPFHWGKGIVIAGSCEHLLEAYVCEVELVPDGSHVTAQSSTEIADGTWVELRVWRNVLSGSTTYTVVH